MLSVLKNAKTVREASDAVLTQYERPADQSEKVKVRRASYGQGYFDKYAGSSGTAGVPFLVRVTAKDLNIRTGAGTDFKRTGQYVKPGVYTILEVKSGKGSKSGWGRLKSGCGWIAMDYATRI